MFTIYHIPGIKIGCSNEVDERVENQGFDYYEVLETHEDIYVASKREIELQKEYGLPVDKCPYYVSYLNRNNNLTFEDRSKAGKIGGKITGKKNVESGHFASIQSLGSKAGAISPNNANRLKTECPHCGKIGAKFVMGRWHFNNCKYKK